MTNKRNIAQEIIDGLRELKQGGGKRVLVKIPEGVRLIRCKAGASQEEFAAYLNISVETLQEWEQEIAKPTGPALSLLQLIDTHPELLSHARTIDPEQHDSA